MSDVRQAVVPQELTGERLDRALVVLFADVTRSRFQQWIEAGHVKINGKIARKRDKVRAEDKIEVHPPLFEGLSDAPQEIALDIVYEDDDLLVINKPPGLIVHPGAGNADGTLLNAILHHAPELAKLPRAGIVHRLDKDTSGLLVVSKSERARQNLIGQLQDRTMGREYVAIVHGVMISGGTVDAPIGRHRTDRKRMAVTDAGKMAVSHYRVLKKYRAHTLIQVTLESGRTHQIRVHMAHVKYPVLGDPTYGGRARMLRGADERLVITLRDFKRQALHAMKLRVVHPVTGKTLQWTAPAPSDMSQLMEALAKDALR